MQLRLKKPQLILPFLFVQDFNMQEFCLSIVCFAGELILQGFTIFILL